MKSNLPNLRDARLPSQDSYSSNCLSLPTVRLGQPPSRPSICGIAEYRSNRVLLQLSEVSKRECLESSAKYLAGLAVGRSCWQGASRL